MEGYAGRDLELSELGVKHMECTELRPNCEGFTSVWKAKSTVRGNQKWQNSSEPVMMSRILVFTWQPDSSILRSAVQEESPVVSVYEYSLSIMINFPFLHPSFTPPTSVLMRIKLLHGGIYSTPLPLTHTDTQLHQLMSHHIILSLYSEYLRNMSN